MKFSELKTREVINIKSCKKLGYISDLELDECTGQICAVIVPQKGRWMNFFCPEGDIRICYRDLKQIGSDIILVDINC